MTMRRSYISLAAGLKTVALFEFAKGLLVLLVGFGLLSLLHKDVGETVEHIIRSIHFIPSRRIANVFIEAAHKVNDAKLWLIASGAFVYTAVRFTEAYGLWKQRVWAEWFALLSGAIYLPWEVYGVMEKASPVRWTILVLNLLVVLYMAYLRITDRNGERTPG